jgi:HEPN domain-containing protein
MDVRAELIVTGMFREGDPSLDPELVPNAVRDLRKHFVEPELRERGGNEHPDGIRQALVEFLPDGQVRVLLDEEADFVALAGPAAKVLSPSDVFVGQIAEVWPDGINPNAGWTGYVTAQGGRVLVCDFRRDLESIRPLLERSEEFLRSAELSLDGGLVAPAIEHLNTSAELAVIVLIRLGAEKVGRDHRRRRQWLQRESDLSDVPQAFANAVHRLASARNPARYAEGSLAVALSDARVLRDEVRAFVTYVATRAS